MPTFLLLVLVPVIGAASLWFWLHKRDSAIPWFMGPLFTLPGIIFLGAMFAISYGGAVADTEIWNGQIISKERKHDTYEEPFECFCSTDSKGNRSCSTCYRTHYTVHWYCNSTIGPYTIKALDDLSRRVYSTPDPARYESIQIGDPVAKTNSYTNYVQAVPNSLFASVKGSLMSQYANMLPAYPDNVYDFYKLNRFITVGFSFTDAAQWNHDISMMLRTIGPSKQVNVIVVVAKTIDPDYTYALQQHWEGVNKNDVVLVIGSMDGQKIEWVRTISWTKEELFKIQLNDRIQELGIIDRTKVLPIVSDQISKNFVRRRMREFEYLKGEIDPPAWLIITSLTVLILGYAAWPIYLLVSGNTNRYGSYRSRYASSYNRSSFRG